MGCLNTVLASASQRFFSVAMADSNHDSLKSQYNASLRISIRLSLLVFVVLETVGLWFVISKMNYPDSMFTEVMIIYQTSIFSFIAMLIQAPYLALVMAYEKMNSYAVISLSGAFLKLALALMLCLFDNHRLMIYGIGWMVVSIITSLCFLFIVSVISLSVSMIQNALQKISEQCCPFQDGLCMAQLQVP